MGVTKKIAPENKQDLLMAIERCPELLTPKFKLMFLRAEVFDTKLAVDRYVTYWKRQVKLLGENAFKPLTAENCLQEADYKFMRDGMCHIIPLADRIGFFLSPENFTPETMDQGVLTRCMYYAFHTVLENETVQKKGFIAILNLKGLSVSNMPFRISQALQFMFGNVPIRTSSIVSTSVPRFFSFFWMAFYPLIPAKIQKRIFFISGNTAHVLKRLQKNGLKQEELPTAVGGYLEITPGAWFEKRRVAGK